MDYMDTSVYQCSIMKKKKSLTASEMGRKGGQATFKKLGREHYQKIANKRHQKENAK